MESGINLFPKLGVVWVEVDPCLHELTDIKLNFARAS